MIDLTHGIAPPRRSARARRCSPTRCRTPPRACISRWSTPGSARERRAVAVRVADEDRVLVGPDNGLLWPAIERLGGAVEAVDVSLSPLRLEPVSATFHGRDVFAPVAAHLARGRAAVARPASRSRPGSLTTLRVEPAARSDRTGRSHTCSPSTASETRSSTSAEQHLPADRPAARPPAGRSRVEPRAHEAVFARTFADVGAGRAAPLRGLLRERSRWRSTAAARRPSCASPRATRSCCGPSR